MAGETINLSDESLKKLAKMIGSSGGSPSSPTTSSSPSGTTGEAAKEALKKSGEAAGEFAKSVSQGSDTLKNLSDKGSNFSNDLVGLSAGAAQSRVSLGEFSDIVTRNGKDMAGLGGNVTRGTEAFAKLSKGFFDSKLTDGLQQMGYTAKEVNEVLAVQAGTMRNTAGLDDASRKRAYESAASLAKEMDLISKLTGKTRQEQIEEANKRKADGQIEAKLRLIGIEQGAEAEAKARAAFQEQFAKAEARGMGQAAKELFATGTVTSEEAATQMALFGDAANKTAGQMKALAAGDIERADKLSKEADAANAKNQRDPTLLRLATLGSAAGTAGDIMKKNVQDNMALHDSIMAVSKGMKPGLTNSVESFGKALDLARQQAVQAQQGQRGGRDVSGVQSGIVAGQIAAQDLKSGAAGAVLAGREQGKGLAAEADKAGRAVQQGIRNIEGPGGSLSRRIEEGANAGMNPQQVERKPGEGDLAYKERQKEASGGALGALTSGAGKIAKVATDAFEAVTFSVTNFVGPKHADGGVVTKPEIALVGEAGPEAIFNEKQLKGAMENIMDATKMASSASVKAPSMKGGFGDSVVSMGKMGLKDDQKKVFDEMMTLNETQSKEKLASLKAEKDAAFAANKAATSAIDAMEEKLEAEGKGFKDLTGAQKAEYDALRKQQNESFDAGAKASEAITAARKAEETKQSLQKLGYEIAVKQEEDKAKIVEETSEKVKNDIKEALPVKDIAAKVEETKTVLTEQQETTLKYAYQDAEGKKFQLENQKNLVKGELNSIAEKNKQIEDIQKEADGRELTQREKNRIEKLQKEVEAGKETLKLRQDDLAVYENLDKLSAERGLKEKQEAAQKEAEIQNQAMLDKLKLEAAGGTTESLSVNGKAVDPNSKEGKEAMAQIETAKKDMEAVIGKTEGKLKEVTKGSIGPIDLNKINIPGMPGFGSDLKSRTGAVPEEIKKAEADKKAAEAKKAEDAKKTEAAKSSEKPKEGAKPAAKESTLSDVVTALNRLNTNMTTLIHQNEELGRKQIQATNSNSKNVYDKT